jgi:hypothetical protein
MDSARHILLLLMPSTLQRLNAVVCVRQFVCVRQYDASDLLMSSQRA